MTIVEMLKKEIDDIEKESYPAFIRNDATDIMISVRFADDTYHHIIPNYKVLKVLTQEIQKMIENPLYWDATRDNFIKSKLSDFVTENEMEI